MKKLLIESTGKSTTHDNHRYTTEDVFLLAEARDLVPAPSNDMQQLGVYLAHRITRNPLDLRAHTQRVYLYLTSRDAEGAYSALLDLYISLGSKGYSLRRHLLQLCSGILDTTQQKPFQAHLKNGILNTTPLAVTGNSLLHKGVASSLPLISKEESSTKNTATDPLSEAREYLEYGQLEPAISTLETAIIADPTHEDIMDELLELYKRAGFLERYHAQSQAMIEAGHILPKRWLSAHQQIH